MRPLLSQSALLATQKCGKCGKKGLSLHKNKFDLRIKFADLDELTSLKRIKLGDGMPGDILARPGQDKVWPAFHSTT